MRLSLRTAGLGLLVSLLLAAPAAAQEPVSGGAAAPDPGSPAPGGTSAPATLVPVAPVIDPEQELIRQRVKHLRTLERRHDRLARKLARLAGRKVARATRRPLHDFETVQEVTAVKRKLGKRIRFLRERIAFYTTGEGQWIVRRRDIPAWGHQWLDRMGYCESGNHGGYRANTGNGFYGRYQFNAQTWYGTTQYGLPAARTLPHLASPAEQDVRAWVVRLHRGTQPWPKCG